MDYTQPNHTKIYRIGLLLVDDFAMMSYASTVEPMRAANLLSGLDLYEINHLCGNDLSAISSGGIVFNANMKLKDANDLDILFVIAGGNPSAVLNPEIFTTLRRLATRGVTLGGVSAGPYILALAGVMKDRRMTVHWEHAPSLIERMPELLVARSLYVMDRDRITCAGGTAPLDMMHAMITNHHGAQFARDVSDWFMHTEVRPARDQQRAGLVERHNTNNPSVIKTIEVMENHIADPLSLLQLAELSDVSARQMNRLFKKHIGLGTMQFYTQIRLNQAKKLCEQSTLSITEIALATGFASTSYFSTKFKNEFGISPTELRAR